MKILVNSTPTALWYDIIHEAEQHCAVCLKEDIESYLVFLLMRYTNQPQLTHRIIATEFLQGARLSPQQRLVALQDVGDKCLLFTGLFPRLAEKRLVKISYFVNIGKTAYEAISYSTNDLYCLLGKQFVPLMDVLQAIRQYSKKCPDLLPLQAYDLWNETGSQRALSVLKTYTQAMPLLLNSHRPRK